MEAVYPASASALSRGRRVRPPAARLRHRTLPVTFAEIKEVDEENEGREEQSEASEANEAGESRRRRPDMLEERLGRQFLEFRRRRARGDVLRERDPELEHRAGSEPAAQVADT